MHFLRVALLVSVITTLLPKGLHAVQQQSSSSKALLNMEKKKRGKKKKGIICFPVTPVLNFPVLTAINI